MIRTTTMFLLMLGTAAAATCEGPYPAYPKCAANMAATLANPWSKSHWQNYTDMGGNTSHCSVQFYLFMEDPTPATGCPNPLEPQGGYVVAQDPKPIVVKESEAYFLGLGDWGARLLASMGKSSMHMFPVRSTVPYSCDGVKTTGPSCTTPANAPQGPGYCCDEYAQRMVRDQMTVAAKKYNPKFLLNVGDNFYMGGVTGAFEQWNYEQAKNEWRWKTMFEDVYSDPSLQIPWLSVMGNHDYGGAGKFMNITTQIAYHYWDHLPGNKQRWVMPGKFYKQQVQFDGFTMDVFAFDGNREDSDHGGPAGMFVDSHRICCGKYWTVYGDPQPPKEWCDMCAQEFINDNTLGLAWLDQALGESTADWKVVMNHYADGGVVASLDPIMQKHGVQLYIAGHTHQQQLFPPSGAAPDVTRVCTGGGGGYELTGISNEGAYGFVLFKVTAKQMDIQFIDFKGNPTTLKQVPQKKTILVEEVDKAEI